MPMYWTFNCFLGCIYTVYYIVYIVFLVLNWLSNLEFRLPKKEDQVARIGVMGGGGFRWFRQCLKENVFFQLTPSLSGKRAERKCRLVSETSACRLLRLFMPNSPRILWIVALFNNPFARHTIPSRYLSNRFWRVDNWKYWQQPGQV